MAVAIGQMQRTMGAAYAEIDGVLREFLRRRLASEDDAQDLAQEVYLRLTRLDRPERVRCLKAFAFRTALNLLRDRARRVHTRVSERAVGIDDVDLPDPGADPQAALESDQALAAIERALGRLHPATRQAFLMHRIDERPQGEVAAALGVSVSMVEKHIVKALTEVRRALPA
jgi:RNA polymerase sigma-70 factor (ECF subfamily)